jgi:hypothetical protein
VEATSPTLSAVREPARCVDLPQGGERRHARLVMYRELSATVDLRFEFRLVLVELPFTVCCSRLPLTW